MTGTGSSRIADTRKVRTMARRGAAAAIVLLTLAADAVITTTVLSSNVAAAGAPYTNTLDYGAPSAPLSVVPPDLDVQIHGRDPSDLMSDPMDAGHGTDCSAPPATHNIQALKDAVFACKDHLMTAIGDSGYGEVALTANHLVDWSTGTTKITWYVSTQQDNSSDWIEVWIMPFSENVTFPFEDQIIDFQGPPKDAIVFSLNMSGLMGSHAGDVSYFNNHVQTNPLPKLACTYTGDPTCIQPASNGASVVTPSATTRTQYEIDISSGHIKFGLPGVVTWTDANTTVPFNQGIIQLVHHSYNPLKHDPGTGIDTFHWSSLSISNAIPFTILNGAERSINAGTSPTIHFPSPAPAGSFLRFSALGNITYSVDGGNTFLPAVQQEAVSHIEHFTSYFTPIPAGTDTVLLQGTNNAYGQPWWVRDPSIWSLTAPPAVAPPGPGPYNPVAPTRILDTRNGTGGLPIAPMGPAGTINFQVTGKGPIPATGVSAVVMNVTATNTTAASYFTLWPAGLPQPNASNLNWTAGKTVPNLVEVALGINGQISIYNGYGKADVILDVAGYVSIPSGGTPTAGLFNPITPTRVMDTRTGTGVPAGSLGAGQSVDLPLAGGAAVPSGASAVVLNVTVTGATAASYVTVFPTGTTMPVASNLNFVAGQTVPNRVIVKVGNSGSVSFFNGYGNVQVIADVAGWFTDGVTTTTGSMFTGLTPARILDTRFTHSIGPGATLNLPVAGAGGVPPLGSTVPPVAVVLNVTITGPTTASAMTIYPDGAALPLASDLNYVAGLTVANMVIVKLGSNGSIDLHNLYGSTQVIVDVVGWYG